MTKAVLGLGCVPVDCWLLGCTGGVQEACKVQGFGSEGGENEPVKRVVFFLKLAPKFVHQLLAVAVNRNFLGLDIRFLRVNWPANSTLRRDEEYFGLRLFEIRVDPLRLEITNDVDFGKESKTQSPKPAYIELALSKRLAFWTKTSKRISDHPPALLGRDQIQFVERLEALSKVERHQVSVVQNLRGQVKVVDGAHRVIATYVRDGDFRNLDFFVTI